MEYIVVSAFFSVLVACQCAFKSCVARDTITHTTELLDNGETLLSAGKKFELGFFNPQDDTHGGRYIGIWFYNLSPRTVVWVANRNNASLNRNASFLISADGNLQLLDNNGIVYFHTNLTSSTAANRTLMLQDSGNLALIDEPSKEFLWESFSDPTDTFLPGMKMDKNLKLVSWLDTGNPTNGNYTFQEDQQSNRLHVIMKENIPYWKSDGSGSTNLPIFLMNFLSNNFRNDTESSKVQNFTNASRSITYRTKRSPSSYDYFNWRLLMNSSGEIQLYTLQKDQWSLKWHEPRDACSVFRPCGNFGMCKLIRGASRCNCLPGFDPVVPDNWKSGDFRDGCIRTLPICIEIKQDKFLNLKSVTVQEPGLSVSNISSEDTCKQHCLNSCETQCQAYYYDMNWRNGSNYVRPNCLEWTSTLNDLRHNVDDGQDIFIRVPASAIASTNRDCEPCGEYRIPYPLSTERGCGDPLYNSFICDDSTDQLFFLNNSYEVIDIKIEEQRFVIQLNITAADNCDVRTSVLQLNQSMPFDVTNWCYSDLPHGPSTQVSQLIEIGWRPPLEPNCESSSDCEDWPDSDCSEKFGTKKCFCNSNYRWDDSALKCKQAFAAANPKLSKTMIIVITVIAVVLLAGGFICFFYRRRRILKNGGSKESIPGNPLHGNEGEAEDLVDEGDNVVDLPYFSLESILVATDNFADVNKLGRGGFGPVYKGTFPGGKEMAIKRLLSCTGQGLEEFRNEVVLIAKLQHRNLVRLLGYCTKGSEKLLLYEYMPNRSLDTFIFDQGRCILLDWNTRFNIITGIARGLLYLHQDSRLRIIHRDLKTSNILLDEDMNPKISDFGLARIFAGKEMEANTLRVVGTYGYMSPEYAQAGLYSVKSDVFSFGVILLEIVSGKRNTRFYHSGEALSLPGYAWRLWEARNEINLFDSSILQSCNGVDVLKCINIGLLCVQEDPDDRPTMSNVLIMLTSEVTTLPSPKEPGFISGKYASSISTSSLHQETNSENKMSITLPEGR